MIPLISDFCTITPHEGGVTYPSITLPTDDAASHESPLYVDQSRPRGFT